MKGKRHTPEQVRGLLAEVIGCLGDGATIAELARHVGIT